MDLTNTQEYFSNLSNNDIAIQMSEGSGKTTAVAYRAINAINSNEKVIILYKEDDTKNIVANIFNNEAVDYDMLYFHECLNPYDWIIELNNIDENTHIIIDNFDKISSFEQLDIVNDFSDNKCKSIAITITGIRNIIPIHNIINNI